MIIDTRDGRLYLAIGHAEERLLDHKVKTEWAIETLLNPDKVELNALGREEYMKKFVSGTITVVVEDDDLELFDGIIVTIIRS